MAVITGKRKLNTKSIENKYTALKEVEGGETKSQVARKQGIPENTSELSPGLKNKDKIFEATKKRSKPKRQRLRWGTFANLDQAIFKSLLVVQSGYVAALALLHA